MSPEASQELGNDASKILYEASILTHANRPGWLVEMHKSFSGFRAIPLEKLHDIKNLYVNLGLDGVGTKIEVSERLQDHSVVAFDLFAMVCDDAVIRGAEPIAIGTILDVNRLDDSNRTRKAIGELAAGYVQAAAEAGVIVVNGEIAELGDRVSGYGDFNYNWGATVLWAAHKERILTGKEINAGDSLVGLSELGFRSNGITDVRTAMFNHYGANWQDKEVDGELLGRLVQKPSTIYTKLITNLTGGYDIEKKPIAKVTGMAHITGGGQPEKLGRMLEPSRLGAVIDDPLYPPEMMRWVQKVLGYSDEKAYSKWHFGPGMIVATPEPEKVIEESLLSGIGAKRIGEVTVDSKIRIRNRGCNSDSKEWLVYDQAT